MSRLLDPKKNGQFPFSYRPAASTDVRLTFEAARKRMEEEKAKTEQIVKQIRKQK